MNVCFFPGRGRILLGAIGAIVLALAACEHGVDETGPDVGAKPDQQSVELVCSSPSARCPTAPVACADLAELASWRWSARADDLAQSTRTLVTTRLDVVRGLRALRLTTASGSLAWLRYAAPSQKPINATGVAALELVVRGRNTNSPTWQGNAPVVALVDTLGRRRLLVPDRGVLSSDGATWTRVSVPLAGGPSARGGVSWSGTGVVDLGRLAAIEIGADTWGAGFSLDVDGVAFVSAAGAADGCAVDCPARCSGQGTCDEERVTCECDVGATGAGCERCRDGFVLEQGRCVLPNDAAFTEWPNDASRANSDAWLAVHHDEVEVLRPKVLVLNFVNPSNPQAVDALVEDVRTAFEEASRPPSGGEPALQYQMARSVVDLRDGVGGRAAPPAGYPFENSTLFPRRTNADGSFRTADYRALFSPQLAGFYGYVDTATNVPADLCTLVNVGAVHEVWAVVSGAVADSGFAETLEIKPFYDLAGNKKAGEPTRCAGNGCFEADVPFCGRSLRVLAINYQRGPGCALHSFGHGVEGMGTRGIVPGLDAWFTSYAGFDLRARYGVPYGSMYELGCEDADGNGEPDSTCAEYPLQDAAVLHNRGATSTIYPYDARCGNVHFPPNATWHYEYGSERPVSSSCANFGQTGQPVAVDARVWNGFEQMAPDCGGGFLIWWLRNMPRHGSPQAFADGTTMRSMWPYLFY
ncbi:MAG: hypothetical protein HYS27_02255 [Deltaproteobacteria bacterium]|nr:hypothetical protein [Deltaproteobacteria bacterium]